MGSRAREFTSIGDCTIQKSLCYSLRKMPKLKKQMTRARVIVMFLPSPPTPILTVGVGHPSAYTMTSVSLRTPNGPVTTPLKKTRPSHSGHSPTGPSHERNAEILPLPWTAVESQEPGGELPLLGLF